MSRSYQHFGLTNEADNWLVNNCQREEYDYCPHCGKTTKHRLKVVSRQLLDLFYGDGPVLRTFIHNDGRIVKEIIQVVLPSCGPCAFTCLQLEDGIKIGKWDEAEIETLI